MKKQLTRGMVYWIMGFTAPKVFDGEKFHCLLTDQVIEYGKFLSCKEIESVTGWTGQIYKPERFVELGLLKNTNNVTKING